MKKYSSHTRLVEGRAEVQIGNRSFTIARRDERNRSHTCPVELVVGALGSWITLTIAAVAENKKIIVNKIDVNIACKIEEDKNRTTTFVIIIDLGSGLTRRERTILFHVARLCEVHKMLAGESSFDYRLKTASLDEHFAWGKTQGRLSWRLFKASCRGVAWKA